ncbi:matrixin family metalloprotease [Microbulbifer sp. DLAB2-AA]|uniref:matrixin family metalloprotease n=1 Tax=Microbulbifer sp. DLAB2-AA TaxID=3243394 RepID=UPI00403A11D4
MSSDNSSYSNETLHLELKSKKECDSCVEPIVHKYGENKICVTDKVGYPALENRSPLDLVLHSGEGYIPLWGKDVTLRWKFDEESLRYFKNPDEVKNYIRALLGEALLKWGDASPVKFNENPNVWDFKIRVEPVESCSVVGCTLARAFFPNSGRNELVLFPTMFEQSRKEQVDTMIHELGHIFGLRHFFADVKEKAWPSVIYGLHKPFSIMNYGEKSELTEADKNDLKTLYELAWSKQLTEIDGTQIRFVKPYHEAIEQASVFVEVSIV